MSAVVLLLRKDLTVLRRSPLLLAALLAYPIVIALLVGLVAGYASSKPRVAWVDEDNVPAVVQVAGTASTCRSIIDEVSSNVTLVRMSADEAARELSSGKVVATITVPSGFVGTLETAAREPEPRAAAPASGALASRVTQQVQALVYRLNRQLQGVFIKANLVFVQLLLHGGKRQLPRPAVHGARPRRHGAAARGACRRAQRVQAIRDFVRDARIGLAQTGDGAAGDRASDPAARSRRTKGRSWVLSAQVQSYGIALTVTFLALLLAAGAAAAERDEGTIGRLRRGLVSLGQLVWSKVALAAVVGARARRGDRRRLRDRRRGRRRHGRRAVGARCRSCSSASRSRPPSSAPPARSLGALAREARTASLLAVLVVLPVVFLGLVPREALAVRVLGERARFRSPTPSAGSARRSTTRARGGRSASRRPGSLGIGAVLWGARAARHAPPGRLRRRTLYGDVQLPRRPPAPLPPHGGLRGLVRETHARSTSS